jgi:hypothetical protein
LGAGAWSAGFGWRVALALAVSATCIALAWRRSSRLEQLAPPATATLLAELSDANPCDTGEGSADVQRRAMIADLNQRIGDVAFELGLLPATYTALTRVCLASGTALTLLGVLDWADAPLTGGLRAFGCALSGLVGAGVVAMLGRRAKRSVEKIRESWDRSSRELGKALGTSLTASRE